MKKIVVLGSTNTDMVIAGKKIPVPGETVCGGSFLMNPGGKGANQAVAVARLSAKKGACIFIAKVGDDLFGRETATRLRRDGILPRRLRRGGVPNSADSPSAFRARPDRAGPAPRPHPSKPRARRLFQRLARA